MSVGKGPITERDRRVLEFAAEHRLILPAQAAMLLGVSPETAARRLRALRDAGLMRSARHLIGPGCYLIDRRGLGAIGSRLPRPRDVDPATYRHDVGLGWLWLAARRGAFGSLTAVVSERRMRSDDGRRERRSPAHGIRLPGVGPRGGERRHYPDFVLHCASGQRVAVELELTPKARVRREAILGGYAVDKCIDAVLYLVTDASVGRAIESSARAIGVSPMVHVQRVRLQAAAPGPAARVIQRAAQRPGAVPPGQALELAR